MESGRAAAVANGYKPEAEGARHCRNCEYGEAENEDGEVWCRMFRFLAQGEGVCDEWERERP